MRSSGSSSTSLRNLGEARMATALIAGAEEALHAQSPLVACAHAFTHVGSGVIASINRCTLLPLSLSSADVALPGSGGLHRRHQPLQGSSGGTAR